MVGQLLEEQLFMEIDDIASLFSIDKSQHSQLIDELLVYFPVVILRENKHTVIVNLHELIMLSGMLTSSVGHSHHLHWSQCRSHSLLTLPMSLHSTNVVVVVLHLFPSYQTLLTEWQSSSSSMVIRHINVAAQKQ